MISITRSTPEALPNPENAPDAVLSRTRRNVDGIIGNTRERTQKIRAAADTAAKDAEAAKETPKAPEAPKEAGAEKNKETKGKPEPEKPEPKPKPPAAPQPAPEPKRNFLARAAGWTWEKLKVGSLLGTTGGIIAGGSSVESWPLLGKIPYLPQAAAWLKGTLLGAAESLNIGTGSMATNSIFQMLPTATAPIALGGAGLYVLGKLNAYLNGKEKSGLLRTIWNGVRSPVDIPLGIVRKTPTWIKNSARKVWDFQPIAWARNKVVMPALKITGQFAGNALKPTGWGVGGAAAAGLLLFPNPGFLMAIGAGYVIPNLIKNYNIFKKLFGGGAGSSTSSHA